MDLNHVYGGDLVISSLGDLEVTDPVQADKQHLIREILTSPEDYIWNDFGIGAGKSIGSPKLKELEARIRIRISKNPGIAKTPAPVVQLTPVGAGAFTCMINYTDVATNQQQTLSFSYEA